MVTICMLTLCIRSTRGISRVSPGSRTCGITRPNRSTTPRSNCRTTRIPEAATSPPNARTPITASTMSMPPPAPDIASYVGAGGRRLQPAAHGDQDPDERQDAQHPGDDRGDPVRLVAGLGGQHGDPVEHGSLLGAVIAEFDAQPIRTPFRRT